MNNGPYTVPKVKNDKGEMIDKPKDQYTSANWDRKNLQRILELSIFFIVVWMLMNIIEFLPVIQLSKSGTS